MIDTDCARLHVCEFTQTCKLRYEIWLEIRNKGYSQIEYVTRKQTWDTFRIAQGTYLR